MLIFENETDRIGHTGYYLPTVEIKDYDIVTDGRNSFGQLVNNDVRTYDNILKINTGNDYTTCCLLDYTYFKVHYKLIAIDLNKQQALNADSKTIQ